MPTYLLATKETEDLLMRVIEQYHERLLNEDVRVGILMAFATVDEETGEKKGHAIKGYAGAAAGASVKKVPTKDRLTKRYDVELLLDGDAWPYLGEAERVAILDHEMTHIQTTGKTDDLNRPVLKMRDEDFIVWGFLEVVQRHGRAAMEHRSLKALIDTHGNLLLGLEGDMAEAVLPPRRGSGIDSVTISMPGSDMEPVTMTGEQFINGSKRVTEKHRRGANEQSFKEKVGAVVKDVAEKHGLSVETDVSLSPTGAQINDHLKKKRGGKPAA